MQDPTHQVGTGRFQQTRLLSRVEIIFSRFNYVVYEGLGSHLGARSGFWGFVGGILNGTGGPFFYVENESNLLALFCEDHLADIPARFRPLTSEATGRWIYLYCQPREIIWEVNYRGIIDWDAVEFHRDANSDFQPVRSEGSGGTLFSLLRADLPDCYAIALPEQINPKTADMIFSGSYGGLSDFLHFSRVRLLNRLNDQGPGEGRLIVFDPEKLIDQSVEAMSVYSRLMALVDARLPMRGLSADDLRIRRKGILACLCKQLAQQDSSVEDDFDMARLDADFTRYADYASRKAHFVDNIYNFLTRPMVKGLEKQFMVYQEAGKRPDGRIWLRIIFPVAPIAGDHTLLSDYLVDIAQQSTTENAWATFFKASLGRGTAQETLVVQAWKTSFSQVDAAEMISTAFTIGTYELLYHYVGRPAGFSGYADDLRALRDIISRDIRAMGRTSAVEDKLAKVASIYRVASGLGELKAIMDGDLDPGHLANVFDSLANVAALRGASGLAMKAMVVKNIFDVYSSSSGLIDRLQMEDYDAAVGNALVLGAGLAEIGFIGYCVATGTSVGGPVGAIIGLVSAAGAVIVMAATDSDTEFFANRCMWGKAPGEGSARPAWADGSCDEWRADDAGLKKQLNSIINCLHKYTVAHTFDSITRVIAIKVRTKFLPDMAKWAFRCEFKNAAGDSFRNTFTLQFPSRDMDHYREFNAGRGGLRGSGNFRVHRDGEEHEIEINLGVSAGIKTGEGWLTCMPFGHVEYTVPHDGQAFHLEQLVEHDNILFNRYRDYAFDKDEWSTLPSWGART